MPAWLYAGFCLVAPGAWALALVGVFRYLDRRRAAGKPKKPPPIDYSI
jgi:hypothetical protein